MLLPIGCEPRQSNISTEWYGKRTTINIRKTFFREIFKTYFEVEHINSSSFGEGTWLLLHA